MISFLRKCFKLYNTMRFFILFLFISKVYSDIFCTTAIPECIDCPSNQFNIIIPQNLTHCSYCLCADSITIKDDTIIINNNLIINDTVNFMKLNINISSDSNKNESNYNYILYILGLIIILLIYFL